MWLSNTDVHGCTRFVFDLEFIGDIDKDECYIWDVGCVCSDTGQTFSAVVMPPVPPAHIDAAFDNGANVTHDRLLKLGAASEKNVIVSLFEWINGNILVTRRKAALMQSHACFRCDSVVFDAMLFRNQMSWPMPTLYFDTLLYLRHALRGTGMTDYSLQSIARCRVDKNYKQDHRALSDARCLHAILSVEHMRLAGLALLPGSRSATLVPGIGVATARLLADRGFTSLDALIYAALPSASDTTRLENLLVTAGGMDRATAASAAAAIVVLGHRFALVE